MIITRTEKRITKKINAWPRPHQQAFLKTTWWLLFIPVYTYLKINEPVTAPESTAQKKTLNGKQAAINM